MRKPLSLLLILICGILLHLVGTVYPADQATLKHCIEAFQRKDYATAFRICWSLAQHGNDSAQYVIGKLYETGNGIAQDSAEAVRWYRRAADQNSPLAQHSLGLMYEWGNGVAQDNTQAMQWYQKAAQSYPPGNLRDTMLQLRDQMAQKLVAPPPAPVPLVPIVTIPSTQGQHRRALVIGNAAYAESPLTNPVNDAADMASILRRLGFDTTLVSNANKAAMEKAIGTFTREVPRGSVGLFFFAGHGKQIEGMNYLVPLGAKFSAASDVKYHAVAADWVLARMDESSMDVKLLILDACRNNPLERSFTRSVNRGLAVMESSRGTLIAYATSPGKTAGDGTGRNSPFTARLLRELPIPGRPVELLFKAVRVGLQQDTNGAQVPWEASSLIGEFIFAR
jgi:hypothetical protein